MQLPLLPRRRSKRRARYMGGLLALGGFLFFGTFAQAADPDTAKPAFEEWVTIVLDGKTCGYGMTQSTAVQTPTGPGYLTVNHQEFTIKRLGITLKMTETTKVTEDAQGGVLSFEDNTDAGGASIVTNGVRQGDDMVVSSRGQTQHFHIPRLAALGPEAIRRATLLVPLQPGQHFSFDTFDTDYPQAIVTESGSVVQRENVDVRGVKRDLWRLTSTESYMPGISAITWVDDKGNDVLMDASLPGFGTLHEYVTNRAECLKQPEGAEIFASTLIHPQHAIENVRTLGQAVYRITSADQTHNLVLWNGDQQRVLSSDPGVSEVEITVPRFTAADATWQLPHADTPELHPFLQASAYLEVNAPIIQSLGRQAVGDEKNPVLAAHKIERFVRDYIVKKDLNVGFGSAEETAKSREGDCTEHAVLCAALGRAVGLPTRCVIGFGYVPPGDEIPTITSATDNNTGIFGFHMWAEAWIADGEWVPMDAALGSFDVGHIAITKSALEEVNPVIDLNVPILQMMQKLKIDVVKTVPKSEMPAPVAPAVVAQVPQPVTPSPAPAPSPPPVPAPAPSPHVSNLPPLD